MPQILLVSTFVLHNDEPN